MPSPVTTPAFTMFRAEMIRRWMRGDGFSIGELASVPRRQRGAGAGHSYQCQGPSTPHEEVAGSAKTATHELIPLPCMQGPLPSARGGRISLGQADYRSMSLPHRDSFRPFAWATLSRADTSIGC